MRKIYSIILLVALAIGGTVKADEVTVADGTVTNGYVPIYGYYCDQAGMRSQMIYPASELTSLQGKSITGITFYSSTASWTNTATFKVSLAEVDAATLDALNTTADFTEVKGTGTLPVDANSKMEITFDEPFSYSQGKNILVDITMVSKGKELTKNFYGISATSGSSIIKYGSSSATKQAFLPKATFTYETPASGPALKVLDGTTKISSGYSYSFGLATAGTTKTFTLNNPGTEATPVAVAHTGSFGAALSEASIPAGESVTLTVTMPEATGNDVITISSTAEGIDDFEINVSGTVRDASKFSETLLGGSIPEDWSASGGTWSWSTTNGASNTAWYESSNYRLITPQLTVVEGESFFFEAQGTYDNYQGVKFEYSTDKSTWTASSITTSVNSSWQTFEINDVPAGKYYIALHGWHVNVRNFYGGFVPSVPKDVEATATTTSSATLSWTAAGSETAWKLQYSTDNENWSEEVAVAEKPFELTGLSASTLYYVRVRADIVSSEWSKVTSFRTACGAIDALPWAENFEGHDLNAAPLCWELLNATSTAISTRPYVAIYSQSGYYKDAKALFFRTDNTKVSYAIFPTFSFSLAKAEIAFSHKEESGVGTLVLGYLTNIADASTFIALYTCTSSSNWTDEEGISLASVPEDARLAFQHTVTSSYYDAAVDNITISLAPSCARPTGLGYSEKAAHSVKLAWTSDASAWKVEYSENSDFSESTIKNVTANPYVLSELDANTHYYVRVLTDCGESGESEPTAAVDFTTECDPKTLPFVEDFESGEFAECWKVDSKWAINANAHAGSYCARFDAGTAADLVLPSITIDDDAMLYYWHKSSNPTGAVLINGTQKQTIATTEGDWKKDSVDLTEYKGQTITITIRGNYSSSNRYLFIDDIAVSYKPVAAPTNVVATPGNATATITWDSEETGKWNLQYRPYNAEPEADWTNVANLEAKTHTIEGLTNGTEYEVQVMTIASAHRQSAWTASQTFTPVACPTVTAVTLSDKLYNGVTVSWTTSGTTGCDVRYKASSDENWTPVGTDLESPKAITGLVVNKEYTFAVKPSCNDAEEAWVAAAETYKPVYSTPANAAVASITDAAAAASWDAVADAPNGYKYAVVAKDAEVNWASATATNELTAELSGLSASVDYDFYVAAVYGANLGEAAKVSFKTVTIAPKNLEQVGESTTTTASFQWEANGEATQYQWSTDNTNWSEAQTALTTTVTGLNAGSSYTFYVRSYYSESVQSAAISLPFTTECATVAIGWSESFGTTAGQKPNCWTFDNWADAANAWYTANDYKNTGYALRYNAKTSTANSSTAVMPAITLAEKAKLKFYVRNYYYYYTSYYISGKVVITDGETLKEVEYGNNSTITLKEVDLSEFTGKTVTITFQANGVGTNPSSAYLWIDDVEVSYAPVAAPTSLAAEPKNQGATITWESTEEGAKFNLQYRTQGEGDWTVVENLTAKTYTIDGLTNGTEYEVQVQAVASANRKSDWTASANFTPAACPSVTAVTFGAATYNSVVVNWTASAAGTWDLHYKAGEGEWTLIENINALTTTLNNLTTNAVYTIEVKPTCGDDNTWVAAETTFTPVYSTPANAAVASITDATATASWDAVADATDGYLYIVVAKDATPDWNEASATNELTAALAALDASADYDFYVAAVYGANLGTAAKVSFKTVTIAPANLQQVGESTTTTASFSWEANGAATKYQWSVDNTNWSEAQEELSATVEGLTAGTAYTFYVRSYYSESVQSVTISLAFNTECEAYAVGYAEDFEAGGKPLCWVVDEANWDETFSQGSTGNKWSNRSGSVTHKGNYALYYNSKTSTANSADITLPQIEIDKAAKLLFYLKNNYGVTAEVRVAAEGMETAITALASTGNNFNTLKEIDLSAFIGKTVTITFHAQGAGTSENSSLAIDDIEIAKVCQKPTNLEASATADGAIVTWSGEEDQYQYCVVNSGNDPAGWILLDENVKTVTVTGKQEGKAYDLYVRAYCGAANQSEAVMITFTPSKSTGVENTEAEGKAVKVIENGQLMILHNGAKYNALGEKIQ